MENPRQIKPLIKERFYLRSIYAYKDFLIRRPKNVLNFNCAVPETAFKKTKPQFKLLKALKCLKPVKKVDLMPFQALNLQECQSVFFSVLKSISNVPTVKLVSNHNHGRNAHAKLIKFLPKLRNLVYLLGVFQVSTPFLNQKNQQTIKDPLRYIKCCPKIQSLEVIASGPIERFLEIFKLEKYPSSLKHLFLNVLLDRHQNQNFVIPFQHFKGLESVYLVFNQTLCHNFVIRNIEELAKLPNLQKLLLRLEGKIFPAIHPMLKKIKTLKKLSLICFDHYPGEEAIQTLQDFDQLTHFKIKTVVSNSQELREVTQSIQNMTKLEYLEIGIHSHTDINAGYELQILCQHINNFDSLRHFNLFLWGPSSYQTKQSVVPFLHHILTKPIKLEFLRISSNQLDPAQTFVDFADVFQGSNTSLHTLELNFGIYSPEKQVQEKIISFIQSFSNLQTLSLPSHVINSKSYLNKIIEAIHQLNYLRKLTFGKIEEEAITPSLFRNFFTKRGLDSFVCKAKTFIYDLKSVTRKNPFLEFCQFSDDENGYSRLKELYTWDSPQWLKLPTNKPKFRFDPEIFAFDLEDE